MSDRSDILAAFSLELAQRSGGIGVAIDCGETVYAAVVVHVRDSAWMASSVVSAAYFDVVPEVAATTMAEILVGMLAGTKVQP